MENRSYGKLFLSLFIVYILINIPFFIWGSRLDALKIDHVVVIVANSLLFGIAVITMSMHVKAVKNPNPHVFARSVMGGTVIKLFVLGAAVLIYLALAGKNRSIYAVFVAMGLYIVYSILEVRIALQLNKKKDAGN